MSRADTEEDEDGHMLKHKANPRKELERRLSSLCCIFFQLDANVIKVSGHNKIKVMILCVLKTGILFFSVVWMGLVKVSYHLKTTYKQVLHSHQTLRLLTLMNSKKVFKRNYANRNVKLLSGKQNEYV